MAFRCSPPSSKRPRQESLSPESAPARKTPRETLCTHSEATTTSSSISHDITMEDADDCVLFESSAPAPPPQHHHTHPVTGTRPTINELFGTAARAQTLVTAFNTGCTSTPPAQTTNHWVSALSGPDSRMSGRTVVNNSDATRCHAGTRKNLSVGSPTRGRRSSTADDDVKSSSRRSSRAEMSPNHHHIRDTPRSDERRGTSAMQPLAPRAYREDLFASPFDPPRHIGRVGLTLPQAQSMSVARATPTFEMAALELTSGGSDGSAPGPSNHSIGFGTPRAAAYVSSHRASFLGASSGHDKSSPLYREPSHYIHSPADPEDETTLERPPTRRGRGTSQDLLRAQEAVRRQKEEDADDELAGNGREDDDDEEEEEEEKEEEDEDDREDGMDLN